MKLKEGVALYVEKKRSTGLSFRKAESYFLNFCKQVGDIEITEISTQHVILYMDGTAGTSPSWQSKYLALCRLFEYWAAQGVTPSVLMPPKRPRRRSTFIPYIFGDAEVRALLYATTARQAHPNSIVDAKTLQIFLLILFGTGARVREVLRMRIADIDLRRRCITVQSSSCGRVRMIPIGKDLLNRLREYREWRRASSMTGEALFATKSGASLAVGYMTFTFGQLCTLAGVTRRDGLSFRPRLSDFRPTFAVQRINSWISQGLPLDRMLPALSTYLGFANIESTERYLSMTPSRFNKQMSVLSPLKGTTRWRDDVVLMNFLSTL